MLECPNDIAQLLLILEMLAGPPIVTSVKTSRQGSIVHQRFWLVTNMTPLQIFGHWDVCVSNYLLAISFLIHEKVQIMIGTKITSL